MTQIYKNYRLLVKIGEGSFSTVYKAERVEDSQIFALKLVDLDQDILEEQKQNMMNEIRILASIDHPNIIKFIEAFLVPQKRALWYF